MTLVCPQPWCVRRACCTIIAPHCASAPAPPSPPLSSAMTTVRKDATVLKANSTRTPLTSVCPCKSQRWLDDGQIVSDFPLRGQMNFCSWFFTWLSIFSLLLLFTFIFMCWDTHRKLQKVVKILPVNPKAFSYLISPHPKSQARLTFPLHVSGKSVGSILRKGLALRGSEDFGLHTGVKDTAGVFSWNASGDFSWDLTSSWELLWSSNALITMSS